MLAILLLFNEIYFINHLHSNTVILLKNKQQISNIPYEEHLTYIGGICSEEFMVLKDSTINEIFKIKDSSKNEKLRSIAALFSLSVHIQIFQFIQKIVLQNTLHNTFGKVIIDYIHQQGGWIG